MLTGKTVDKFEDDYFSFELYIQTV